MRRYISAVPTMTDLASVSAAVDVLNEFVSWLNGHGYTVTGPDGPARRDEIAASIDVFMAATRGETWSTWRDLQVPLLPTTRT